MLHYAPPLFSLLLLLLSHVVRLSYVDCLKAVCLVIRRPSLSDNTAQTLLYLSPLLFLSFPCVPFSPNHLRIQWTWLFVVPPLLIIVPKKYASLCFLSLSDDSSRKVCLVISFLFLSGNSSQKVCLVICFLSLSDNSSWKVGLFISLPSLSDKPEKPVLVICFPSFLATVPEKYAWLCFFLPFWCCCGNYDDVLISFLTSQNPLRINWT